MKKMIAVLLVVMLCLTAAACDAETSGGKEQSGNDRPAEAEIYLKEGDNGLIYLVIPSSREFSKYVERVEITRENWQEYFEDYEYTEHVVRTNSFGEVEEEYDLIHLGFGLKRNILGCVDTAAFKFDGMTEYSRSGFPPEDAPNVRYEVFRAGGSTAGEYSYGSGELLKELEPDAVRDYYLLELKYKERKDRLHFGDYNCIDATGVLYIINLPEGIYNGEDVTQIEWANGGGASICVSNLERYCAK